MIGEAVAIGVFVAIVLAVVVLVLVEGVVAGVELEVVADAVAIGIRKGAEQAIEALGVRMGWRWHGLIPAILDIGLNGLLNAGEVTGKLGEDGLIFGGYKAGRSRREGRVDGLAEVGEIEIVVPMLIAVDGHVGPFRDRGGR